MKNTKMVLFALSFSLPGVVLAAPPGILGCYIGKTCELKGLNSIGGRDRELKGPIKVGELIVDRFYVGSGEDDKDGNFLSSVITIQFKPNKKNWHANYAALKKYAQDHFHLDKVNKAVEPTSGWTWTYDADINNGYVVRIEAGSVGWATLLISTAPHTH